jgi:hypothetical protein
MTAINPTHAADVIGAILRAWASPESPEDIAELPEAQTDPAAPVSTAPAAASVTQTSTTSGFVNPADTTQVNSPYGPRGKGMHQGVDLAVPSGTTLHASIDGKVTHAASDDPNGYGTWVEITGANGVSVRYGHLSALGVHLGDTVTAGQPVGISGATGNAEGPHLHFEYRVNGTPEDPMPHLLSSGPVMSKGQAVEPAPTVAPEPAAAPAQSPTQKVGSAAKAVTDVLKDKTPQGDPLAQIIDPLNTITDPISQHVEKLAKAKQPQAQAQPTQGQAPVSGDFFGQVLAGIGAPDTPENRRLMNAWQRAEGGSADNPFNTTQGAPGATDFNSVGVKRYPDLATGIAATIKTLLNGHYPNIIAALKAGNNALAVADAIANSPWGSGALVKKVLGG